MSLTDMNHGTSLNTPFLHNPTAFAKMKVVAVNGSGNTALFIHDVLETCIQWLHPRFLNRLSHTCKQIHTLIWTEIDTSDLKRQSGIATWRTKEEYWRFWRQHIQMYCKPPYYFHHGLRRRIEHESVTRRLRVDEKGELSILRHHKIDQHGCVCSEYCNAIMNRHQHSKLMCLDPHTSWIIQNMSSHGQTRLENKNVVVPSNHNHHYSEKDIFQYVLNHMNLVVKERSRLYDQLILARSRVWNIQRSFPVMINCLLVFLPLLIVQYWIFDHDLEHLCVTMVGLLCLYILFYLQQCTNYVSLGVSFQRYVRVTNRVHRYMRKWWWSGRKTPMHQFHSLRLIRFDDHFGLDDALSSWFGSLLSHHILVHPTAVYIICLCYRILVLSGLCWIVFWCIDSSDSDLFVLLRTLFCFSIAGTNTLPEYYIVRYVHHGTIHQWLYRFRYQLVHVVFLYIILLGLHHGLHPLIMILLMIGNSVFSFTRQSIQKTILYLSYLLLIPIGSWIIVQVTSYIQAEGGPRQVERKITLRLFIWFYFSVILMTLGLWVQFKTLCRWIYWCHDRCRQSRSQGTSISKMGAG